MKNSAPIDEALAALVSRNRAVELDATYEAYDSDPLDSGDEWADLASFRTVESVSLGTLLERLGLLSDERMRQICRALEIAVACEP